MYILALEFLVRLLAHQDKSFISIKVNKHKRLHIQQCYKWSLFLGMFVFHNFICITALKKVLIFEAIYQANCNDEKPQTLTFE